MWPEQWPQPQFCAGDVSWQLDAVTFRFIRPHPMYQPTNAQAGACVLEVSSDSGRVLILGDIPLTTAIALQQSQALDAADLVISQGRVRSPEARFVTSLSPSFWAVQADSEAVNQTYDAAFGCTCGRQRFYFQLHRRGLIVHNSGLHLLPWLTLP
jgi:hypothetical protein